MYIGIDTYECLTLINLRKTSGRFSVNIRVIMNTDFCWCGETRVPECTRRSNAVDTPGTRGNECSIRPGRESSEGESNKNRNVIN